MTRSDFTTYTYFGVLFTAATVIIWTRVLPWIGEQDWMYQLFWRMG